MLTASNICSKCHYQLSAQISSKGSAASDIEETSTLQWREVENELVFYWLNEIYYKLWNYAWTARLSLRTAFVNDAATSMNRAYQFQLMPLVWTYSVLTLNVYFLPCTNFWILQLPDSSSTKFNISSCNSFKGIFQPCSVNHSRALNNNKFLQQNVFSHVHLRSYTAMLCSVILILNCYVLCRQNGKTLLSKHRNIMSSDRPTQLCQYVLGLGFEKLK